jgi:hypothetical protein
VFSKIYAVSAQSDDHTSFVLLRVTLNFMRGDLNADMTFDCGRMEFHAFFSIGS